MSRATHYTQSQLSSWTSVDIPTANPELYERSNGTGLPKRLKNPKITNLFDEILNDKPENQSEKEKPIVIQASLPVQKVTDVQPRTKGDIADYSDGEQVDELPFRTKGGIIGYGGGGKADESSENNHQSVDKCSDYKSKATSYYTIWIN